MKRRLVAVLAGALALIALAAAPAGADNPFIVEVRGGDIFVPGQFVKNNFRFVPLTARVRSGQLVVWVDRDRSAEEPHTVTIANRSELPQNFAQLDACFAPGGICAQTLAAHDPGNDQQPPFNNVVTRGPAGLNTRGDSLLFAGGLGDSIGRRVNAPPGTTLSYLCVIHPWMQGTLQVV